MPKAHPAALDPRLFAGRAIPVLGRFAADRRSARDAVSTPVCPTAPVTRRRCTLSSLWTIACVTALAATLAAGPALAQDYHPNDALGQALAKKPFIETKTNPGGKGILDNSCIYKDSFALSPSEVVLDRCDLAGATAKFTTQYGPADLAADAAGGKTLLEYRLLHNANSYLVKVYFSCAKETTEHFAMVECKVEKNRAKPGRPPDERPFWKKLSPF